MSLNTIEITKENIKQTLEKNDIVFLDFWAGWCAPCRMFGPIFEKVAAKHPEIAFGKVNTETEHKLSATFEVSSIPTVAVFRQNILVFSQPGLLHESALEDLIEKIKRLDMDKLEQIET